MQNAVPLPIDLRLMKAGADLLWLGVAFVALALLCAWAMRWPLFAIHTIAIDGDTARNSAPQVRALAAPKLSGTLFTLDLDAARRVFESVPWVRQATLKRVWPDRLHVRLEEHQPAAVWRAQDGSERLVNTHGEVFEADIGEVDDNALAVLSGPDGSAASMLAMAARLAPLFAPLQAPLETLELSGRGSWRAVLSSGARIELGRGSADEVIARAERFVRTAVPIVVQYERPLVHADLRHSGGYALKLKGVSTTVEAKTRAERKR